MTTHYAKIHLQEKRQDFTVKIRGFSAQCASLDCAFIRTSIWLVDHTDKWDKKVIPPLFHLIAVRMLFLDKFIHHPLIFPSRLSLKCCNDLVRVYVLSCFSRVQFFATLWTVAHQVLCPWDSPGKNTGVGCHFLLQGIFLTKGSSVGLLHCRQILYHWATGEAHNDLSHIYSFRVGILHLGDFAPEGHSCRCCYQHHWGEVLLTCDRWRPEPGCCCISYDAWDSLVTQLPNPTCQPRQAEKPRLGIRPVSFSATREAALELGSSVASIQSEAPPIKLLWFPPSSPALTNGCFKIVTCKVYLQHTESRDSELRFSISRLALCC